MAHKMGQVICIWGLQCFFNTLEVRIEVKSAQFVEVFISFPFKLICLAKLVKKLITVIDDIVRSYWMFN